MTVLLTKTVVQICFFGGRGCEGVNDGADADVDEGRGFVFGEGS